MQVCRLTPQGFGPALSWEMMKMKQYDPRRADNRSIAEKAYGAIMAMNDKEAQELRDMLEAMAKAKGPTPDRARMFLGSKP